MSIDPKLLVSNFPVISGTLGLLIGGKTILVALVGRLFGISIISAVRVGLLLAPGGEFAFVAFGEAVNQVRTVILTVFHMWKLLVKVGHYLSIFYNLDGLLGVWAGVLILISIGSLSDFNIFLMLHVFGHIF